ncbi:S8 family serine peptidase [Actinoplanes sp. NBRC 103695]|uniref:S8 family serine peptidase n=1 Tax=Actinoplanes sp. NBRC 103695 TaxID=3032202 RepID=UPI002553AFC2|nr:S8 family serine peptidase [Actinoplanes sp. NBRC 103695]
MTRAGAFIAALMSVAVVGVAAQPVQARPSSGPPPIRTYDGDPGRLGDPASWRTPEFRSDAGLVAIGAEFAYAAGYAGGGMNIGLVDSGYFEGHELEHGDRYFPVVARGGGTGPTSGLYDPAFNDSHGTHVSGTVAASRDGVTEMHGVAFNAKVYLGNTHKTDGVYYGQLPPNATEAQKPDNAYLANVYRAVGRKPVRIVSSSWGSAPSTENYNTYDGLVSAWRNLYLRDGVPDSNGTTEHWLNGALDVARTGKIIGFSAGNGGVANPTPRGAAPYFVPSLEGRWFTTSGLNTTIGGSYHPDGSVLVPGQQRYNQCGVAKWSCVTAPGTLINSTIVQLVDGVPTPRYSQYSGTSMSAPHSAATLTLIMQRFPYLTNEQALYTMYTTGRQNSTISDAAGAHTPNPSAGRIVQVPDSRNGWHTPSLREAFNGPGQLLGSFDVDTRGTTDVWSNDISDVAIRARRQEDTTEAAAWEATKVAKGWTRGLPPGASQADRSEYAIGTSRERARRHRDHVGSLIKRGGGTLFLTGANTWQGDTTVLGGRLAVVGSQTSPIRVRGGVLAGTGTVAGDIDVAGGSLEPGLTARFAGNTLTVGGDVHIARAGTVKVSVRGATDHTSIKADGDLKLGGKLDLKVHGKLSRGTKLTILSGASVHGTFRGLPEGGLLLESGQVFRASYRNNSVTLTVLL